MSQFIEMFGGGNWPQKTLGEVGSFTRGGGFLKSDFVEHGIPCIHYGQIHTKFGPFITSHITKISSDLESKTKFASKGDLVIAITSEDTEGSCKSTAWLGDYPVAVGGHAAIYKHSMNPLYMSFFFKSTLFNYAKIEYVHGKKVFEIKPDEITKILVPCPPMSLQNQFSAIAEQSDKSGFDELKSQFIEMFGNPLSSVQRYPLKKLGDCCELNPRRPSLDLEDTDNVSFVPMPSVSENGYLQNVSDEEYGKVKKGFTYFENGDVLFAKITPCMENGKGAIAEGLTNNIGMGSTEFHVLRPIEGVSSPYWLLALTRLPIFRERASKNMTGTGGQKRLPANYLENFMVGLPPIEEQNRYENIYKQADKSGFDELKSQFIEMFGCSVERVALSSLCDTFIDGDWIEAKDQSDSGIRLIQTGNVGIGTFKEKGDKARYISEETFNRLNCTEVIEGDILISRLPDPVGRACIIPAGLGKSITAVDCTIIRLNDKVLPKFFVAFINTPDYAMQIKKVLSGTTRFRVSRANLGKIQVPLPSIGKQQQFVTIAEQTDKSGSVLQYMIAC